MEKFLIEKNGIIYINEYSKYTPEEHKYKELWYIADHKPENIEYFNKISKLSKKQIYQDYLRVNYNQVSKISHNYSCW